jgi:hypothetical protein
MFVVRVATTRMQVPAAGKGGMRIALASATRRALSPCVDLVMVVAAGT